MRAFEQDEEAQHHDGRQQRPLKGKHVVVVVVAVGLVWLESERVDRGWRHKKRARAWISSKRLAYHVYAGLDVQR